MGRKKSFDQEKIILQMSQLFVKNGYIGSSLDDLVQATGLLRGSLYSTFGSKLKMFIACLQRSLSCDNEFKWDLVMIALLEVSSQSLTVKRILQNWYQQDNSQNVSEKLGQSLLLHGGIIGGANNGKYNSNNE